MAMNLRQFVGLVPTSFTAVGIDPETGDEISGEIKIWINRLAFKTVTEESFSDAMKNADKDPSVIAGLLAGRKDLQGVITPGVLAKWEFFTDETNSEMLPVESETILDLPFDYVAAMVDAIMKKLFRQPATTQENSAAGLATVTSIATAAPTEETSPISPEDTASARQLASGE